MIVYSSIYGGFDAPKPVPAHPAVTEWRLYTDDPELVAPGWTVVVEPRPDLTARMAAKFRKCHPPEDAGVSLYLDGSVRLLSGGLIDAALAGLETADWCMYEHPDRRDILAEADAAALMPKYQCERLHEQVASYRSVGDGLWAAGILARRHTPAVLGASRDWWEECARWTTEDQLSLPYVLARRGVAAHALPGSLWKHEHFSVDLAGHRREEPRVTGGDDQIVSVVTPLHPPGMQFVMEAYESLRSQSLTAWEWVIVENGGATTPGAIRDDDRVRVVRSLSTSVGLLKRIGCTTARGSTIVELDADDLLRDGDALARVSDALADADFAYSDFAEFLDRATPKAPYSTRYGWASYPVAFRGATVTAMRAPPATEHNVRFVDWAPNHVRAWRTVSYWRAGGHDGSFALGDDHELIVRMLLKDIRFAHIPECLYFYRVHPGNTVGTRNAAVRAATTTVYNRTVWALAEHWARRNNLALVDLCGGIDAPFRYTPIDRHINGSGIECDLDGRWALEDSSVGVLRAYDAVEHLKDPVHTMNEAYRVLAPGGWLMISVPSTNGLGAFADPTHVSFWNRLSFRYYTDPKFARYVPEFCGRFQVSRVIEWFPTAWHKENNVPYVEAHLISCKDGFRAMGECLWT